MSVKERLKDYIEYKQISIRGFENEIGASNSYVNSITQGIGGKYLERIREKHTDLSINWLLTGAGDMLMHKINNVKVLHDTEKEDLNLLQEKVALLEEKVKDKEKIIQLLEANDDKLEHVTKLIEAMNTTVGLSALSIDDFRDQVQTYFETINKNVTAKSIK